MSAVMRSEKFQYVGDRVGQEQADARCDKRHGEAVEQRAQRIGICEKSGQIL